MAVRRPASVCLRCQVRQAAVGRRRFSCAGRSLNGNLALVPVDEFPFSVGASPEQQSINGLTQAVPNGRSRQPTFEQNMLELDDLWRTREARLAVLRKISNPLPDVPSGPHTRASKGHEYYEQKEMIQGPMTHAVFRENIRAFGGIRGPVSRSLRNLINAQLLRCDTPRGFLRLFAAVMQHPPTARYMAGLSEPIIRCMYRCRTNASDLEILNLINVVIKRFEIGNLPVGEELVKLGLKFAARARSLRSMKRYLQMHRAMGVSMSSNTFRSVIAKFSIGRRGLGEIRNGRWKRDELLQVLLGFDDAQHLPPERQYHVETFLDRSDWQFLHSWVAVMARCRDSEALWREWVLWKNSDACQRPKSLKSVQTMNSRTRGMYWFVDQFTIIGDLQKAWEVFNEAGLPLRTLTARIKVRLLDGVEFAPVWSEELRDAILWKYDWELSRIEESLGVRWVPGAVEGDGLHELVEDQEKALDKLGSDNWKRRDPEYGFFIEQDEIALQRAEEQGLAKPAEIVETVETVS